MRRSVCDPDALIGGVLLGEALAEGAALVVERAGGGRQQHRAAVDQVFFQQGVQHQRRELRVVILVGQADDGERWPLDELRTIKTMPMDEGDREKILFRNAQKLLKLPAPARMRPKGH